MRVILSRDAPNETAMTLNWPKNRIALLAAALAALAGCENEPPPRSVAEFMENPILLEAAVVRCAQNRAESRYDPECMNAREAIKIIEARKEADRRAELEAMSERKRKALRRTQAAAAEARRRAEEDRRRQEEADYLAQFGELPPDSTTSDSMSVAGGNAPVAVVPEATESQATQTITSPYDEEPVSPAPAPTPAPANAPVAETAPPEEAAPKTTDLEAIREELKRRGEDGS